MTKYECAAAVNEDFSLQLWSVLQIDIIDHC